MSILFAIFLIAIGGFSSGSFYLPLKFVRKWSWETGWGIYSLFALLIGPWVIAMFTIPELWDVISNVPPKAVYLPILFGVGWGIGGLTWGLSNRYLGIGLGTALPLGLTSALSTLIPPIFTGKFGLFFASSGGILTFAGVLISLVGIAICGWAAQRRENESKSDDKTTSPNNFDLQKGLLVAVIAGVMSACFAFGEEAGQPIAQNVDKIFVDNGTIEAGQQYLWRFNPVYAVLLIGGFLFNFVYSIFLGVKNKTTGDYTSKTSPLTKNYIFAATAGILWILQFIFKGMGTTKMGEFSFVSWSLFFSFVLVFSNMWGLITKEWKGVSGKTIATLFAGISILIISAIMIGIGSNS
jgi:L-rhamnose-H+ transport protein